MTKKPLALAEAMAKKPVTAPTAPTETSTGEVKTLTLRLSPIAHDQLRELAFTTRRSQHSLLLEGLNLIFEQHGKPLVAL